MNKHFAKLRPAVTAALALSIAVPAPVVRAAELDALETPNALPEDGAASETEGAQVPSAGTSSNGSAASSEGSSPEGEAPASAESASGGAASSDGAAPADGDVSPATPGPASAADSDASVPLAEGDVVVDASTFPDAAFRAWVLDAANLGGAGADGVLTRQERESVTGILAKRLGIRDITGIELFPNLTFIDFEGNYIEQVDLSGNPELLTVYLRNNCLTSIDFSHNTKLKFIEIFDNRLSEIDLTMLPDLEFVHLDYNNLKVIDLSRNTKLVDDGFVGNNNPLEKIILPRIEGRSFDSFVISELDEYEGYTSTLPEWYTTPDFQPGTGITPSTVAERTYIPFDGQTLYVKRAPNAYTVRFDANGGTGSMESVERTWDDGAQALPESSFVRTGYRFLGWSKDRAAASAAYGDRGEVQNIGGARDTGVTVTLYAVWEPIEESSGYFRSQLGDAERAVYDDIASQLGELTDPADPSSLEVRVPDEATGSLERVLFAVLRDHPEYFWVDYAGLSWVQTGAVTYALAPRVSGESYFVDGFTADNLAGYRERFDAQVESIVASAPADPVLAVRYFNSWLCANNVYNPSGLNASNFSRTAASGILSSNDPATGPVCYGYATAMKVLLDRAGIENAYVEGWAYNGKNGSGEQHAWNYVLVDGAWYAVDPTWNDPASASAPALETYLLVGSSTVTAPSLAGKESFGANHDSSKSPAARLNLGYPTLSTEAYSGMATGLVEVVGENDSQRFDTLDEALAVADAGQTVRLWGNIELTGTVSVSHDVVIDLNGHGLSCSSAAALRVANGASLELSNSAGVQATVSSHAGVAVANDGALVIDPWVSVKGAGMSAVSGAEPQAGGHAYLVRTTTGAYTAYEVAAPASPAAGTVDVADAGGTIEGLCAYVNGEGSPQVEFSYISAPGSAVRVPDAAVPAYSWELSSAPVEADGLHRGVYTFKTTVFGHELTYSVEVTDRALEQAIDAGAEKIDAALAELESRADAGLVTSYDLDQARAEAAAVREAIAGASSADEVDKAVSALLERLDTTPTTAQRASELEAAWRSEHMSALALVFEGSVSFENAASRSAAARDALDAADAQRLAARLPEGMGDADRALVASVARSQIEAATDGLTGLEALAAAATWSQGAADVVDGLPDPVTADDAEALQALVDGLEALDADARRLVSSADAARVRGLLEDALAATDGDGQQPGGDGQESGGGDAQLPDDDGMASGGAGGGLAGPGAGQTGSGDGLSQQAAAVGQEQRDQTPRSSTLSAGTESDSSASGSEADALQALSELDAEEGREDASSVGRAASADGEAGVSVTAIGIVAGAAALVTAAAAAVRLRRRG